MRHLRLVVDGEPSPAPAGPAATTDAAPKVPLRLLMAASGRCDCADCCRAYLAGDRTAGRIRVGMHAARRVR